MRRKTKILAASFLAAAFAVTGGLAVQGRAQAAQYRHMLQTGYLHAFAELTTAVGELDTALQKGAYATTPALFSSLCAQAYGKALAAQMALGELPYGNVELEQTAAFLAKAGDYAMALARGAYDGQGCSAKERDALRGISAAASTLAGTLRDLQWDIDAGAITLEDLAQAEARLAAAGAGEILAGSAFQTVEADFPEVPSLVYDGPFSDHIAGRAPLMLEGAKAVTQDEARARAAAFLGLRPEIFDLASQGEGQIPAWGFSAAVDGGEVYVEVTRRGGYVLEVLSSRPAAGAALTREEAAALAAAFLEEQGYPGLRESYFIDQGDALTIHFAAVQEGVLCYPDLVKITIALDTGNVIGFEAAGYLSNHHTRSLPQPQVGREDAQAAVGEDLEVLAHQLAVIPTGGQYEVLCHEFKCQTGDGRHLLVYVNAQTGQEEKILLLLEDGSGTLAL